MIHKDLAFYSRRLKSRQQCKTQLLNAITCSAACLYRSIPSRPHKQAHLTTMTLKRSQLIYDLPYDNALAPTVQPLLERQINWKWHTMNQSSPATPEFVYSNYRRPGKTYRWSVSVLRLEVVTRRIRSKLLTSRPQRLSMLWQINCCAFHCPSSRSFRTPLKKLMFLSTEQNIKFSYLHKR